MPEIVPRTAGGSSTKILVPIVEVIGIDIDLRIARIPVRVDETSARPTFSFVLSVSRLETILYLSGLHTQYKTAVLFYFDKRGAYKYVIIFIMSERRRNKVIFISTYNKLPDTRSSLIYL